MKERKRELEDLLARSIELQRRQLLLPQEKVTIRVINKHIHPCVSQTQCKLVHLNDIYSKGNEKNKKASPQIKHCRVEVWIQFLDLDLVMVLKYTLLV